METLDKETLAAIGSKFFSCNPSNCKIMACFSLEHVFEISLDILFRRRGYRDIAAHYSDKMIFTKDKYVNTIENPNLTQHKKHCNLGVLTDDELRLLGVEEDTAQLYSNFYTIRNSLKIDGEYASKEALRQQVILAHEYRLQLDRCMIERDMLDNGEMPPRMKKTFKSQDAELNKIIDYGLLAYEKEKEIRKISDQLLPILSDIQKNNSSNLKATKNNTMIINVVNATINDMEQTLSKLCKEVQSSLELMYPNMPELPVKVRIFLAKYLDTHVVPLLSKSKQAILIENK